MQCEGKRSVPRAERQPRHPSTPSSAVTPLLLLPQLRRKTIAHPLSTALLEGKASSPHHLSSSFGCRGLG